MKEEVNWEWNKEYSDKIDKLIRNVYQMLYLSSIISPICKSLCSLAT